jgi:hypothetical protein
MNRNVVFRLGAAVMTAATIACNLATPTRPTPAVVTGGTSSGASLKVSAPTPQSPANGAKLTDIIVSGITLSAGSATPTFAESAALQYEFELTGPDGFRETSGIMGNPSWRQSRTLEYATQYSWRVRAVQDGAAGPWSSNSTFTTTELPPEFRCRPPFVFGAVDIMLCHIDVMGGEFHEPEDHVIWLKRVARDFNFAGVPGGPYGILQKRTGNNCGGYSCDILCSGQGNNQLQFDVLIDDRIPVFGGGGNDVHDGIRVDVCEIQ